MGPDGYAAMKPTEMSRDVFEMHGLECAYGRHEAVNNKMVLRIEDLSVPMGKITIILGQSGSGKSTLIETLGLMNHTVKRGTVVYHSREGSVTIGAGLWKKQADLARIRNRHFSFIFQHDFLMPHYSPEENMRVGMLISDARQKTAGDREDLRSLCRRMGLDLSEIRSKRPCELSVGQRQRLSFIRAILKNYSVIFGDEPTGNLDEANAWLLMDVLAESIRQKSDRSAILVSHNIRLSVAKADCLVILTRQSGDLYEILPGNVYTRTGSGWLNNKKYLLADDELSATLEKSVNEPQPPQ